MYIMLVNVVICYSLSYVLIYVLLLYLKGFVQKGRISNFWPIFIFCRIELIFGRLSCFDMKSIVP